MAASNFELFNRKLMDFLSDLRPIIGQVPEYGLLSTSARLMAQVDERKNQQFFDQFVAVQYEDRILQKDEAFFLEAEFKDVENVNIVQMLKSVWGSLSADERDAVWAHLQVLLVLNRRCKC